MAKRRTLKQKKAVKHQFSVKWTEGSSKLEFNPGVKRQIPRASDSVSNEANIKEKTQISVKNIDLERIKQNIVRTLLLSGLILISEVVIYFIWK